MYNVVLATVENIRTCTIGREKFAHLQIQWMGMVRFVLHKHPATNSTAATLQHVWELFIVTVNPQVSLEHSNALFLSMYRAAFINYWQTKVMRIKQSSELDDDVRLDTAEEAALAAGK